MKALILLLFIGLLYAQIKLMPRVLKPDLPGNTAQSIASLINSKYQVGLVLNIAEEFQSTFVLYDTSDALANASSQLISQITFQDQSVNNLISLSSGGIDWFVAIFNSLNTSSQQDQIGAFRPNDTKPEIIMMGGYRTTISTDATLNCQECLLAAMMLEDYSWVVRKINFTSQTVIWEYLIPQNKFAQIYEVQMAVGLGNDNLVNIFGLNLFGQQILQTFDISTNETLMFKTFGENGLTSFQQFYPGYNIYANEKLQVGIMNLTSGNVTASWNTSFSKDPQPRCAAAYPNICCGNVADNAYNSGKIYFWSYNMTTQPTITIAKYIVQDDDGWTWVQLKSAPSSKQFIFSTSQQLKIIDYSQLDEFAADK